MKDDFRLADDHLPKAQQWALALRRRTMDYWFATLEGADAAHAEAALATVAVNVLDEAVFEASLKDRYVEHRRLDPRGRVVVGLEFIRNCEIHSLGSFDLVESALFGMGDAGFRQVLSWPALSELPTDFRFRRTGEHPARGESRHFYEQWVAGRPVVETLLDAISFFESLEQRTAPEGSIELAHSFAVLPLGAEGETVFCKPTGLDRYRTFLPDLACRATERRAPDWPSADLWLAEQDKAIRKQPPAATSREVTRRVVDEHGKTIALAGLSDLKGGAYRAAWIERVSQVGRDVRMGCRYFVSLDEVAVDLAVDDQLRVRADFDELDLLQDLDSAASEQDLASLGLLEHNPDLYRRERLWS